ncbi:MAG: FtsW/RodA/SpoVE family cell cycle protein [Anaerolineae bacterium]|nr:FtsW/RodA/SpoVE family cell cycle protein [Anaerolineae bacterium]MCB9105535.1 FtsW/RodA/SpoVE family cell cycle protein [Anaerolineales bacterium]
MPPLRRLLARSWELRLLVLAALVGVLGFALVTATAQLRQGAGPLSALPPALLPPAVLALSFFAIHFLLCWRQTESEQLILPIVALLVTIGAIMIWRLRPPEAVWQQLLRGFLPGVGLMALLVWRPRLVERIRQDWPVLISLGGLVLLIATAFFGVTDETGARLSLKLGPLPAIQTSEIIKLALIIFLAWYIESEGQAAEGRARTYLGWLRLPAIQYMIPGLLFVSLATLALIMMSDFGAILILGGLFVAMLYAGFQPRIFFTIVGIGLAMSLVVAVVLALTWSPPLVIQQRFAAFLNPWSAAPLIIAGQPTGATIAEGPGYQIQQAIYATIAGGVTGTGLGFGYPGFVPLAHSDFIFAAILEEMGAAVAVALLGLFAILLLRLLRVAMLLPPGQVFERILLVGIAAHLFIQVTVMIGGTLNALPLTGVTVPFLSQGGIALMVNLIEIGLALALVQRLKEQAG